MFFVTTSRCIPPANHRQSHLHAFSGVTKREKGGRGGQMSPGTAGDGAHGIAHSLTKIFYDRKSELDEVAA